MLRGFRPADIGALALAIPDEDNPESDRYRVFIVAAKVWEGLALRFVPAELGPMCSTTWNCYMPDRSAGGSVSVDMYEWDSVFMQTRRVFLPALYRYIMELEQCEHESAVSPDGKRRTSPLRCMNCGKLVY